jgi:hypothetical protein
VGPAPGQGNGPIAAGNHEYLVVERECEDTEGREECKASENGGRLRSNQEFLVDAVLDNGMPWHAIDDLLTVTTVRLQSLIKAVSATADALAEGLKSYKGSCPLGNPRPPVWLVFSSPSAVLSKPIGSFGLQLAQTSTLEWVVSRLAAGMVSCIFANLRQP